VSEAPLIVRGGLQVFPLRRREEFESSDAFFDYIEEVNRYNNGLPPRKRARAPAASSAKGEYRQVGVKLDPDDYERLAAAAKEHGVSATTLARILVVAAVRGD